MVGLQVKSSISVRGFSNALHVEAYLLPLPLWLHFFLLIYYVILQNYGPWFDISGAGVFSVIFSDLKSNKNFSSTEWIYQVVDDYFGN